MTTIHTSACAPWATVDDMRNYSACAEVENSPSVRQALDAATALLFEMSGRQFTGLCQDVVRPIRAPVIWNDDWWGANVGQMWNALPPTNWWGYLPIDGDCSRRRWSDRECGCSPVHQITLGGYPVVGVQQVLIDGVALPTTAYRVDDDRWLVRLDGEGWPLCQDITADTSEANTFEVTYHHGVPPTADGVLACAAWACDIYQGFGGGECKTPARVVNVARQGVTMEIGDALSLLDAQYTGIPMVDRFLMAVNPQKLRSRASVMSPDIGWPVIRTTGGSS